MQELLGLFDQSRGLVIGENHASLAAIKFLIDHAAELQRHNVTHLFIERFSTVSRFNRNYPIYFKQQSEDTFAMLFEREIPEAEANLFRNGNTDPTLKFRDDFIKNPNTPYTMSNLIKTMKQHGITIIGIDAPPSVTAGLDPYKRPQDRERIVEAKNRHMYKHIYTTKFPNSEKFIALLGTAHAGEYLSPSGTIIHGLAHRLECPSIYLCEVGLDEIYNPDNSSLNPNVVANNMTVHFLENASSAKESAVRVSVDHVMALKVIPDSVQPSGYFQCIRFTKTLEPIFPLEFDEDLAPETIAAPPSKPAAISSHLPSSSAVRETPAAIMKRCTETGATLSQEEALRLAAQVETDARARREREQKFLAQNRNLIAFMQPGPAAKPKSDALDIKTVHKYGTGKNG